MKRIKLIGTIGIMTMLLHACSPAMVTLPEATATAPEVTATAPEATTTAPEATQTLPVITQTQSPFPLSEPVMYHVGKHSFIAEDASRDNRKVYITVWYPALPPADPTISAPIKDAIPDPGGAPYPLILSSTKVAGIFAPYLVSHGFAWVSVDRIDWYFKMNQQMIDQPLHILFALEQVASNPPAGLEGLIDAEHAGTIGYSFDGYNTLAMSGARIDPEYYLAQCPTPDATTAAILSRLSAFDCAPAGKWDEFSAHAGKKITDSKDGLWQPITDERIKAVMPMAGEGWWWFGEKGLASVDRPTLIIAATQDELYAENAIIFEHLGTTDKTFISFVGKDHDMIIEEEMIARMAHFAVAFFGYHLQGRQDLAMYFSQDFVAQHDDLAWGVYQGE